MNFRLVFASAPRVADVHVGAIYVGRVSYAEDGWYFYVRDEIYPGYGLGQFVAHSSFRAAYRQLRRVARVLLIGGSP